MDAIQLLIGDHNRVKGLFAKFEAAEEADDTGGMAAAAAKIIEELEVHTRIEEEIFYPAIHGESEDVKDIVDEGVEEHHVANVLMEEIRGLDPSADEWKAKMKVLVESVEHHLEEEEGTMFPQVREEAEAALLEDLGARMEMRKAELGGPTPADAQGMTKAELMEKAKEQGIPGRSSMSQEDLTAAVDARG